MAMPGVFRSGITERVTKCYKINNTYLESLQHKIEEGDNCQSIQNIAGLFFG